MKKFFSFAVIVAGLASSAVGQEPTPDLRRDTAQPSMAISPTPEMWFYEQERIRHDDPKLAVRRHAEIRGAQRQSRIESMKWYGMSNSRPSASPTPHMSTYSPMWTSNTSDPYRWTAGRAPAVVLLPGSTSSY